MGTPSSQALLKTSTSIRLPSPGNIITSTDTGISYEILGPLAVGGFSNVFLCTDDWGHQLVAKVLKPVGETKEMEARAVSEVVAAAVARSPHIVHVHDAFELNGAYYIIAEKCASTLLDMMCNPKVTPSVWFRPLTKAVLHGVHYMYTRGLVHCDIHPGNVFLHSKPDIILFEDQSAFDFKLGDFGQTRLIGDVAPAATWNVGCVPPEVLDPDEFGPIDHRADLYQAGLLFLRFLSQEALDFDRDDILAGRPRELAEALPHPASPAIACMLRRHADARPKTALAAWHLFEQALSS